MAENSFDPIDKRTENTINETNSQVSGFEELDKELDQSISELSQENIEQPTSSDSPKITVAGELSEELLTDISTGFQSPDFKEWDRYGGSAWDDFVATTVNAGMVRTAQGLADIPAYLGVLTADADWAKNWMEATSEWADGAEGFVSKTGNKSFFETGDLRSLAGGLGQGIGSMIPMLAAAGITVATGGAAAPVLGGMTTAGTLAGVSASAINMMPSIVDEGLYWYDGKDWYGQSCCSRS
jgi:hypothetical protein